MRNASRNVNTPNSTARLHLIISFAEGDDIFGTSRQVIGILEGKSGDVAPLGVFLACDETKAKGWTGKVRVMTAVCKTGHASHKRGG